MRLQVKNEYDKILKYDINNNVYPLIDIDSFIYKYMEYKIAQKMGSVENLRRVTVPVQWAIKKLKFTNFELEWFEL